MAPDKSLAAEIEAATVEQAHIATALSALHAAMSEIMGLVCRLDNEQFSSFDQAAAWSALETARDEIAALQPEGERNA